MVNATTSASLFYSLSVCAADLVAAGRVLPPVELTFVGLALIAARWRKGVLETEPGA